MLTFLCDFKAYAGFIWPYKYFSNLFSLFLSVTAFIIFSLNYCSRFLKIVFHCGLSHNIEYMQ